MKNDYFYQPNQGHGLPHNPFRAMIAPRPIAWISTQDRQGNVNLAPYSFFNAFSEDPPLLGFSSLGRKDTLRNIEETGEFVVNMVTQDLAQAMNITSLPFAADQDEMTLAGLQSAPSRIVSPSRVAQSPMAMECKLVTITPLQDIHGRILDMYLTIGEVVGVHILADYLNNGLFDLNAAQPIMRAGYAGDYVAMGPMFEMLLP